MEVKIEEYLKSFRETNGEEAWKKEVKRLVKQAIQTGPMHETYWRELTRDYDWLDWDALKESIPENPINEEIPEMPVEQALTKLLFQQMPGIKSQAQYNAVVAAMDTVKLLLNSIMEGNKDGESEAHKALEMALEATRKATELTLKLSEVPEAATSKRAEEFKKPPVQLQEYSVQKQLLKELEEIQTMDSLDAWYAATKEKRDQIVSQNLRNILMDEIRAKKLRLLA